jgi:hypothetical protein
MKKWHSAAWGCVLEVIERGDALALEVDVDGFHGIALFVV